MRVACLSLLLFLPPAWLGAEESGLPPLDPLPKVVPLAPLAGDPAKLSDSERLRRRLEELVRDRDGRAHELLSRYGDLRPPHRSLAGTPLEEPAKERDRAWDDLQRELSAYAENHAHTEQDVLNAAKPGRQAAQHGTLAASNQLRIAECYHDLAADGKPTAGDLAAGMDALVHLDAGELPESERPRLLYLRVWFLVEQARQTDGEPRAKLVGDARASASRLRQEFATSDLAPAAERLVAALEPTAVPTP
jgi:hypothetical protein